ncbi:hypothetical protein [Clostridium oceanicum]|uniref:Uncharacterized protein n=1 Tax=Clostridium oceanicum TaxID=1543 RepID=A0ABP3UIL4_9CLOT
MNKKILLLKNIKSIIKDNRSVFEKKTVNKNSYDKNIYCKKQLSKI